MEKQSRILFWLFIWVLVYLIINQCSQIIVSPTADLDQAEQLLLGQAYRLGYGPQPPLYTYLSRVLFSITGPNLIALLIIKVLLLGTLVASLMGIGHRLGFTLRQHVIMIASLVLLPQIIFESQRDLTHSVIVTSLSALTLFQIIRMATHTSLKQYLLLGLLFGAGLLGKYNYLLFLAALLLALVCTPGYRKILFNRYVILTLIVAAAITMPHLEWVMSHQHEATSSAHKMQLGQGGRLEGLANVSYAALVFFTPLWLLALLVLPARPKIIADTICQTGHGRFLLTLLLSALMIVVVFVLVANVAHFNDRWFQPLFFYVPLLVAAAAVNTSTLRYRWYTRVAFGLALLVMIMLPSRTLVAEYFDRISRPNYPYQLIFQDIAANKQGIDFIISDSQLVAGNARLYFTNSVIFAPTYRFGAESLAGKGLLICSVPRCAKGSTENWLREQWAIDTQRLNFKQSHAPYFYAPSKTMTIYYAEIQLN